MGVIQANEYKVGIDVGAAYGISPELLARYNSTLAGSNNPFFDMTKAQKTGYTTGSTIFTQNTQGRAPAIVPETAGKILDILKG